HAEHHRRPAVPERTAEAQHPRTECGEAVRPQGARRQARAHAAVAGARMSRTAKNGGSRHTRTPKRSTKQRKPAAADPADAFCAGVKTALERGEPDAISDEQLRRVLTSAVKL